MNGHVRLTTSLKRIFSVTPRAPLAQLAEQLTLNQRVLGSSPKWRSQRSDKMRRRALLALIGVALLLQSGSLSACVLEHIFVGSAHCEDGCSDEQTAITQSHPVEVEKGGGERRQPPAGASGFCFCTIIKSMPHQGAQVAPPVEGAVDFLPAIGLGFAGGSLVSFRAAIEQPPWPSMRRSLPLLI